MAAATRAYVGLGANLGDGVATLREALAELAAADGIAALAASPLYRSAPVDAVGPDFINAVAALDTVLPPLALLDLLQTLESRHGRERPYRNAPRTLDLDLLLCGDTTLAHERLILPHPRMHQRAFVLRPLRDLAPTLTLGGHGIDAWLGDIAGQPLERIA